MADKKKLAKALKAKKPVGGPPVVTPCMKAQKRDEDIDGQAAVLFEGCLTRIAHSKPETDVTKELDVAVTCLRARMALRGSAQTVGLIDHADFRVAKHPELTRTLWLGACPHGAKT